MEEVYKKFENLKKLCKEIDSNNEWVKKLSESSFELFICTIKNHINGNPNIQVEELYNSIITTSRIDEKNMQEVVKKKVKRYIEYFLKIAKL